MPSTDLDDARFTNIDWEEVTDRRFRPNGRTIGLLLALLALGILFVYDYTVQPDELVGFLHWDLNRMDWLAVLSTVLFVRYALVPIAINRERSVRLLRRFLTRPAGVVSLLYLVAFALLGLFGLEYFDFTYAKLGHRLQPPVYTKVNTSGTGIYNCVGTMVNDTCYGSWQYPLGTTYIGEDVSELLLKGIRVALKIALATAMIMGVVATAVGTAAGYFGGWVDDVLMRYVDVQQTVPAIVVYLVLATMYFGNYKGVSDGGLFAFVLVFGLLDWGGIARLVRSEVLKRRSAGYVRAAKAAGASDLTVIRRHIVPNSSATIVTALTRRIPLLILAQVALAYLELNRATTTSLGRVLRIGLNERYLPWHQQWWVTTWAVLVLVATVVAFNVFGDTVRDVLDPQEEVE